VAKKLNIYFAAARTTNPVDIHGCGNTLTGVSTPFTSSKTQYLSLVPNVGLTYNNIPGGFPQVPVAVADIASPPTLTLVERVQTMHKVSADQPPAQYYKYYKQSESAAVDQG